MAKSIQHNVAYVACGSGCASAGGDARCSEGCIGCGACVAACPHGAIALVDGIARVDRSKCTGCGLCGMACPQRVIAFVPGYQNILVRCNNTDKGAIARKICDTSCIGCGMCAKKCPAGAIRIEDNCAHIITYATMATKNSLKDVARVEKLPLERSNALCKAIPDRLPDGMKMNLANAIKCTPELQDAEVSEDPRERNTIKYAKMLEGTVRGTGLHACGFIICRDRIDDWVPVSTATDPDFPEMKCNVTQYDGHVIETTGLIKMDFLGLKTLSELKEACKVVKQTTGHVIDLEKIPIDDELTYQLYQQGRTIGTFQFESAGMQKYLRELKPTVFEDLIAMNALYRPGPMDYIPSFIARKNGREKISYDIPCMEKYLKDTYGITVYQEQVMLLSRQLANFTRGESDALRKAMGKKKKAIVDQMKPKFIKQGTENGHDPKVLEKIWGDWEKFASYAFNKSHATCYSWVAYQTAYVKAHYPAEFMAALMTRRFSQITEITKLMEECKALKISTLGPDVNESQIGFGVNKKGEIRFGLSAIKGMGTPAAEAIVSEREKNGPYKDIFDFAERVNLANVNRKAFESLAYSGGFDGFGVMREQFFTPNAKG